MEKMIALLIVLACSCAHAQEKTLDRQIADYNAAYKANVEYCRKMVLPTIGVSYDEAIAAVQPCWGAPTKVSSTTTAGHVRDQAIFYGGGRYLYFDNQVLTAVTAPCKGQGDCYSALDENHH